MTRGGPDSGGLVRVWGLNVVRAALRDNKSSQVKSSSTSPRGPVPYLETHGRERGRVRTHGLAGARSRRALPGGAVQGPLFVIGRQQRGKQMWYEVVKCGRKKLDTQWVPLEELEDTRRYANYVKKLVKNYDQKQQALDSGMAIRPITSEEILTHLADFGIDQQVPRARRRHRPAT